jgi:parvulin-like peptidyl-prolyl isomerase
LSHILLGELTGLEGEELETAKAAAEVEALDVLDRLAAGEEFAAVATDMSTDTVSAANGGELGCGAPSQYVTEFGQAALTAPIGEVLDTPVETMYGYHVILVTDRTDPDPATLPTEEQVVESMEAELVSQGFQEWLVDRLTQAEVTIDERFGTWETDPSPRVVAPVA